MRMTTAGRWAAERRQEEEEEIGVYKAWAEADAWPDDPAPRGAAKRRQEDEIGVYDAWGDAWPDDPDARGAACERCVDNHSLRTEWEPMPEVDMGLSEPRCRWCDD